MTADDDPRDTDKGPDSDEGSEPDEEYVDIEQELSDGEGDRRTTGPRERLEEEADRAKEQFDEGIVDLLAWVLDTETRARIFVYLRQHPDSTSEEIAAGTGLYPSTVREALAELHEEEKVTRHKRASSGAGNNPFEYRAIAPSELVGGVIEQVQDQLNTVFNLDRHLEPDDALDTETEPVSINVEEEPTETGEDVGVDTSGPTDEEARDSTSVDEADDSTDEE